MRNNDLDRDKSDADLIIKSDRDPKMDHLFYSDRKKVDEMLSHTDDIATNLKEILQYLIHKYKLQGIALCFIQQDFHGRSILYGDREMLIRFLKAVLESEEKNYSPIQGQRNS